LPNLKLVTIIGMSLPNLDMAAATERDGEADPGVLGKRERKAAEIEPKTQETESARRSSQDIESTAEQIKDAAQKVVVAVEKIAGLKPARARKISEKGRPEATAGEGCAGQTREGNEGEDQKEKLGKARRNPSRRSGLPPPASLDAARGLACSLRAEDALR